MNMKLVCLVSEFETRAQSFLCTKIKIKFNRCKICRVRFCIAFGYLISELFRRAEHFIQYFYSTFVFIRFPTNVSQHNSVPRNWFMILFRIVYGMWSFLDYLFPFLVIYFTFLIIYFPFLKKKCIYFPLFILFLFLENEQEKTQSSECGRKASLSYRKYFAADYSNKYCCDPFSIRKIVHGKFPYSWQLFITLQIILGFQKLGSVTIYYSKSFVNCTNVLINKLRICMPPLNLSYF